MDAASSRRPARQVFPCLLVLALGVPGVASAATRYVIPSGGATTGPCASWATACTLQTALGVAASGDEVWVAAGVFLPTTNVVMSPSTTDREKSFLIPPGVLVYGGFAGTEVGRADRDPRANVTILSGDIDGDDTNTDGNSIDETTADITGTNSYHVVFLDGTGTPITSTTVLDGFTVTGGNANGTESPDYSGGGLFCNGSGAGAECSPKLAHLTFRGNRADSNGGAIFNFGNGTGVSSPSLNGVTFSGNSADSGGAIYNLGGGGVSSPSLTNVTFSGNHAGDAGGAMVNSAFVGTSRPTLVNVTFSGNSAVSSSGAILNSAVMGTASPTLTNVILWHDSAPTYPEMQSFGATSTIDHSVVDGGCGSVSSSCGAGNLDTDPKLGPLQDNGGPTETMALGAMSSALDTGAGSPTCPETDQRGAPRPQGGGCDIGAYEVDPTVPTVTVEQAAGQADPTGASPILFTATFSEPIDLASFTGSDVTLGGTAPGTLSATLSQVAPMDGTTFDIAVSGMTGSGTVIASIAAAQVTDVALNDNEASTSTDNSVTYDTSAPVVSSTSLQPTYVAPGPSSFTVTFNEPVVNPRGSGNPDDVTNPANYLLVEAGTNATFDTVSCAGGRVDDDTQVPVAGVIYDSMSLTATVSLGGPLPIGTYRLFVCGTTSITDPAGNKLNGGADSTFDLAVLAMTEVPALGRAGLALLTLLLAAGALMFLRR